MGIGRNNTENALQSRDDDDDGLEMVSIDNDDYDQTQAYMKANGQTRDERYDDDQDSDDEQGSPDVLKVAAAGIAANKLQDKYKSERLDSETKGDMLNEIQGNAIENVKVKTKSECKYLFIKLQYLL